MDDGGFVSEGIESVWTDDLLDKSSLILSVVRSRDADYWWESSSIFHFLSAHHTAVDSNNDTLSVSQQSVIMTSSRKTSSSDQTRTRQSRDTHTSSKCSGHRGTRRIHDEQWTENEMCPQSDYCDHRVRISSCRKFLMLISQKMIHLSLIDMSRNARIIVWC